MRDLRFGRWFLISWLLLSCLSVFWSFATPIGAAPDEPAHMVKAASVVRGQWLEPNTELGSVVRVPRYVAYTQTVTCFAFEPETTAACSPQLAGAPDDLVPAQTTAGLYNPVYYLLVGWPSLVFGDVAGLYVMRIASAVLTSAFLALALAHLANMARRPILVLGAAVATTPMVLFLDGSVNPNALEITATLAVFTTMIAVITAPARGITGLQATTIAVAASLAVNTRGISALWVAIALFAPMMLTSRQHMMELIRMRAVRLTMVVVGIATAFALAWVAASNSLGSGVDYADGLLGAPGVGTSPLGGFAMILLGTFNYALGMIGVFGWLDTPAPAAVFFVWSALVGTLLLIGCVASRGRARKLAIALVVAAVLLPPIIQAAYITRGGLIWQGRYLLPLFVCVVIALALAVASGIPAIPLGTLRPLAIVVMVAWVLAQTYAFVTAMRRYAVGLTGGIGELLTSPEWAPPGGILPLTIGFGAVALLAGILLTHRIGWQQGRANAWDSEFESLTPPGR